MSLPTPYYIDGCVWREGNGGRGEGAKKAIFLHVHKSRVLKFSGQNSAESFRKRIKKKMLSVFIRIVANDQKPRCLKPFPLSLKRYQEELASSLHFTLSFLFTLHSSLSLSLSSLSLSFPMSLFHSHTHRGPPPVGSASSSS